MIKANQRVKEVERKKRAIGSKTKTRMKTTVLTTMTTK